jgi:hypothetical protein
VRMAGQAIGIGIVSKSKTAGLEHCRSSTLICCRENVPAYGQGLNAYHNPPCGPPIPICLGTVRSSQPGSSKIPREPGLIFVTFCIFTSLSVWD